MNARYPGTTTWQRVAWVADTVQLRRAFGSLSFVFSRCHATEPTERATTTLVHLLS